MCGIAGILRLTPPGEAARAALDRTPFDAIPEAWLNTLDDSIRHRGPDGQGRFRDRAVRWDGTVVDVAFVHRRLSIIDHGGGAQPMVSQLPAADGQRRNPHAAQAHPFAPLFFHGGPDATVDYRALPDLPDTLAVVFNGCVYNHRELRAQLQAAGHRFLSDHSDTEVFLHGWRQWGGLLSDHLESMHASALWNRQGGELQLSADWVGEKPLYYCHTLGRVADPAEHPWCLAFGSSPAGLFRLLAHLQPGSALNIDRLALEEWVGLGYGRDAPARVARLIGNATVPYERMPVFVQRRAPVAGSADSRRQRVFAEEEVDSALAAAVDSRLDSDVPLGCFLSGGVDSSLVAHFAKQSLGSLRTFTVRMPDARYDESEHAEAVASHVGTVHRTLDVAPTPVNDLLRLIPQLGLPLGDSSMLPAAWVARAARREVAVALNGDGGDELFAGYERHAVNWSQLKQAATVSRWLPQWLLRSAHPRSRRGKLARAARAASWENSDVGRIYSRADLAQLLGPDSSGAIHIDDRPDYTGARSSIERDFWYYLPDDLLRKSDTATMSVALEGRAPLLASQLVKIGLTSTLESLMPGGQRKGLLRAVARRHLPAHIVDRPKMGFAIPIGEWFRSDYGGLRTLLLDHMNSTEPFGPPSLGIDLNMAYVRQMLDEHLGTGKSGLVTRDHSQRLYMLLVLSIWAKWLGSLR